MSSFRRARGAVAVALIAAALAGCGVARSDSGAAANGPIVTEIYPFQFIAQRVVGPDEQVVNLAPPGVEPHDLELAPSQVAAIAQSRLVIYLGGFAPAVDEAVEQNASEHGFDVADVVDLVPATADDGDDALDPHFWLDPTLLAQVGTALAERLGSADPANATAYAQRARDLAGDLDQLDREFAAGLATCDSRVIVTSHSAFGYLASRYHLEQVGVAGLEPEAEPSAARISEVQRIIESENVTTLYAEPLASAASVDTIAADLGLKTATLDPLESLIEDSSGDYFSVMRDNLAALRTGLGCT